TPRCRESAPERIRSVIRPSVSEASRVVVGTYRSFAATTREASDTEGRITDLIRSGALSRHLGVPELDPETDRVMLCGSMAFNVELKELLEARGFTEGSNNAPADFVLEKAFVG
ncbi:MAG: ferredoxin--NADP reductase, partial [Pseudomonadota bacterium]